MSLFYALLLCLFVSVQVPNFGLCENAIDITDWKPSNVLSPIEPSVERQERDIHHRHQNCKTTAETNNRQKRDSGDVQGYNEEKRLRDFVGKRSQTVAYPSISELKDVLPLKDISGNTELLLEPVADDDIEVLHGYGFDGSNSNNERQFWYPFQSTWPSLREVPEQTFYTLDSDSWVPYDKRFREFVGKREWHFPLEKRLRDFVGKRGHDSLEDLQYKDVFKYQKRLRDFVGKRTVNFPGQPAYDQLDLSKRLRDFVGKREENSNFLQKRPREFVGKREWVDTKEDVDKRLRDFVGKRNLQYSGLISPTADKRFREFVGKRDTTSIVSPDKRLRDFVGKRHDKRAREFVGKRFQFGGRNDDSLPAFKRLRDFVGKRSHLYNSETHFGRR